MARAASSLDIERVRLSYGRHVAVDDVSVNVAAGEFLGLLGPSGCGKTTLLRMVAGFLAPDEGRIVCDGTDISHRPPYDRRFGVVFQNYALFPHMTAAENVAYGLKVARVRKPEIAERVKSALDRVGLQHARDRYPRQLSGGMQQRVALARALVIEPAILLLDEPLSALDKNLREEMQVELRLLQQNVGVTTIFVTHDQEEAMTLSDRIAVMREGKILQIGSPSEVYAAPVSRFVSTFLGTTNLIDGRLESAGDGVAIVNVAGRRVQAEAGGASLAAGQSVTIAVRPEDLIVGDSEAGLPGHIVDILFQGHRLIVIFRSDDGQELRAFAPVNGWSLVKGDRAYASWRTTNSRILTD